MPQTADVVIIGGGIIGCVCAHFLSRDGHRAVLVEATDIAARTASASGGWIVVQDKDTPQAVALALQSRRLYDDLAAETGFGLSAQGGVILATGDADLRRLRAQARTAHVGGADAEVVDAQGLHALEPAVAKDLAGGLFCRDEATVDPPEICRALLAAAQRRGLQVCPHSPVTGIDVRGGRVVGVVTTGGPIAAPLVICACGAWSPTIARMVGLLLPVQPRRGHLLVTAPRPLARRPMLEAGYLDDAGQREPANPHGVRFVLQPRRDGRLLVGSSREFEGFDPSPDPRIVDQLWVRARRFVPTIESTVVEQVLVGFRPYTPIGRPIIGRAGPEGFIVATGHEGEGVTLAPVTGRMVGDLIAGRLTRTGFELPS